MMSEAPNNGVAEKEPGVPVPVLPAEFAQPGLKLASFDVFDTVITRHVGIPAAIFELAGREASERGLVACSPEIFALQRHACEQRARTNKDGREVSLLEIHEELARVLNCGDHIEELMEIEMEVEAAALRTIPGMRAWVDEVRKRFGKVIFVSDMYLPKSFLRMVLEREGLLREGDGLYLSSEEGVQKADGRMFGIVLEREGIAADELLHTGDSRRYDIEPAEALGIRTHFFRHALSNPSEQVLNRNDETLDGFGASIAGASRLARLDSGKLGGGEKTMWDTGCSVTGPLVLLYSLWLLDQARSKGVAQMYFLARDAYFPFKAFRAIADELGVEGIRSRYVYGSRPTYLALGVKTLDAEGWDRLTVHGDKPCDTIRAMAGALMARREVMEPHLAAIGFGEEDWDRSLDVGEISRIRDHALSDGPFNRAMLGELEAFRDRVRAYFAGLGFDPGKPTMLVDTGWTTRSHAPLFDFLREEGCTELSIQYIGIMVDEPSVPVDSLGAFMFDRVRKHGSIRFDIYYPRPFETLLFADHGRTSDFEELDGKVRPMLTELENPAFIDRYFEPYEGGIDAFLRHAVEMVPIATPGADLAGMADRVIERFWENPTAGEAKVFSTIDWEWDPQGNTRYALNRPYRYSDAWMAFKQKGFPECHPQFWVAGSKAITPKEVVSFLGAAIFLARGIRSLTRRLPAPLFELSKSVADKLLGSSGRG